MFDSMHPTTTQPTINLYLDPWGWRENCERQTMHPTHEHVADEFGIARADLAAGLVGEPVEPEFVVRALWGFTDVSFDELFLVA